MGKKVCGPKAMQKTVKVLCEKGEKRLVVTPYWVEKESAKIGLRIDHDQAESCLEAVEAEDYGQLCQGEVPDEDQRSSWELIRLAGPGKKWLIDPPETSFSWWPLVLCVLPALGLGFLAWQARRREDKLSP